MTTTQSTDRIATQLIENLAANLYSRATELAELPFVGGGEDISAFIERQAVNARNDLHLFLKIHSEYLFDLDRDWERIYVASETARGWDEFEI